eukprot:TRINITY_DN7650_c0_g3_i1.p1 TRINITY_DN7650_c0_g3~~TRINITY_DN7650_c0_g3_i1.p1  ORF type:complete len:264 (+),score=60.12 TRINITY_DN7650_c0_g3_i1:304-1095(+)
MIDPSKDPEGYARYMKEREEKRKKERQQQRVAEESKARLQSIKTSEPREFKEGLKVMVFGLQKNPEKNGSVGTLKGYIADKERWTVEFHNGSTNNFKVDNLQIVDDEPASAAADDNSDIPTSKIYISNLSAQTTEEHLIKLFSGIGVLAREPVRNAKGKSKGFQDEWPFAVKMYKPGTDGGDACVEFLDKTSAKGAIKAYNDYIFKGSKIRVEYAGGGPKEGADAEAKRRDRSRSRERIAALNQLKKKLDDEKRPAELAGIFG